MKCPHCFSRLSPVPTAFMCEGSCEITVDEQASRYRGYQVSSRRIIGAPSAPPGASAPVSQVTCQCQTPTSQEVCPTCHYPIPKNWRSSRVMCIAYAGARTTGKSLMLAVTKLQLDLVAERHWKSTVNPVGDTAGRFELAYLAPLLKERRMMRASVSMGAGDTSGTNNPIRDPFIWQINVPTGSGFLSQIISFRDVAGEDLEKRNPALETTGFFSRADAVIVLIDPLSVGEIRDKLHDFISHDTQIGGDGLHVLQHVLGLMNGGAIGQRTKIPVAVALSKFDMIQKLRDLQGSDWSRLMNRPGSPLWRDNSLATGNYQREDGDLMHEEVKGLLEKMDETSIAALLEQNVEQYRLFAVSALGELTEHDRVHPRGITPFRVLDPLKWALHVTQGGKVA